MTWAMISKCPKFTKFSINPQEFFFFLIRYLFKSNGAYCDISTNMIPINVLTSLTWVAFSDFTGYQGMSSTVTELMDERYARSLCCLRCCCKR